MPAGRGLPLGGLGAPCAQLIIRAIRAFQCPLARRPDPASPAAVVQAKSKEAKARAAMAGGKGKKKKWSKGKSASKLQNAVLFDAKTYDKLKTDVPKMKIITVATVSERMKISGSLARVAMKEMESDGLIRRVLYHRRQQIFTRSTH